MLLRSSASQRAELAALGERHDVSERRTARRLDRGHGDDAAAGLGVPVDGGHVGQAVVLGRLDDPGHRLDRLDRVGADAGLAGQHHGVGAVEDGVRDVGGLGPGGPRVLDHRLEHLGGHDDRLGAAAGLVDDQLLVDRHVLERALHAEVAAGHHHPVERLDDPVDRLEGLRLLDLGDDRDPPALLLHHLVHVVDVRRRCARSSARRSRRPSAAPSGGPRRPSPTAPAPRPRRRAG